MGIPPRRDLCAHRDDCCHEGHGKEERDASNRGAGCPSIRLVGASGGGADVTAAGAVDRPLGEVPAHLGPEPLDVLAEVLAESLASPVSRDGGSTARRSDRGSPPSRRSSGARTAGCSVRIGSVLACAERVHGASKRDRWHRGAEIETTRRRSGSEIPPVVFHDGVPSSPPRSPREFGIVQSDLNIAVVAYGSASSRCTGFLRSHSGLRLETGVPSARAKVRVMRNNACHGIAHKIDETCGWYECLYSGWNMGHFGKFAVARRRLASDWCGRRKMPAIPIFAPLPVTIEAEEVQLLLPGHRDLRMGIEIVVHARCSAFHCADDDQVRQRHRVLPLALSSGDLRAWYPANLAADRPDAVGREGMPRLVGDETR